MQLDHAPIPPIELLTPRLRLRPLTEADRAAFVAFELDNADFFAQYAPPLLAAGGTRDLTVDAHAAFDRALLRTTTGFSAGTGFRLCLFLPGTGQLIGQVGLSDITRGAAQRCNIGYRIARGRARQGLMSEAIEAVLTHAFRPGNSGGLHLHRVECSVQPDNLPSLALARKLGFQEEGYFRNFLLIAGAWRDHIIFARTAP